MRLSVLTPDRRPYPEMTVPVHVEAGTLVEAELPAFALPAESTETLGIWWVDYTLLDAAGVAVQYPVRWHRFVVSPADVSPYQQNDLYFSIQTDSEAYPVGGRAEFTFLVFNNTNRDRVITVRPDLGEPASIPVPAFGRGQLARALDPVRQVNGSWIGGGWVSAGFYDVGGTFLGTTTKSFGVYLPAVELDILIARSEYGRGETVPIELKMLNKSPANQRNDFSFTLLDPSGTMLLDGGTPSIPDRTRSMSRHWNMRSAPTRRKAFTAPRWRRSTTAGTSSPPRRAPSFCRGRSLPSGRSGPPRSPRRTSWASRCETSAPAPWPRSIHRAPSGARRLRRLDGRRRYRRARTDGGGNRFLRGRHAG